ncbi:MAG: hypothetical protein M1826_003742 [Phylliscum demangeonii]|nr:MAG: hypothetical protein M1826_003742 [Phylliscum demangeonii]
MKSWLPWAVAVVHLCGPASALPHPMPSAPQPDPHPHLDHPASSTRHDYLPTAQQVRQAAGAVLRTGGSILLAASLAGAAVLRERQRDLQTRWEPRTGNWPRRNIMQELMQEWDRHRASSSSEPATVRIQAERWEAPAPLLADAVMMECVYEYVGAAVGGTLTTGTVTLGDAIEDCARYHHRRIDASWFTGLGGPNVGVQLQRRARRATAWAEKEALGRFAAKAANRPKPEQFEVVRPSWANRVEIGAERNMAKLGASVRHVPAYYAHLARKEGPVLRKEGAAVMGAVRAVGRVEERF